MRETIRDGSTAVALVRQSAARLRSAVEGSRLLERLPTHGSTADDSADATASGRSVTIRNSRIVTAITSLRRRSATAADTARVTGIGASARTCLERSFCYRWLTAEPDPDVIVIDLRETATVGPPLRAVQRSLEALAPSAASARLTTAGRATVSVLRARPIRVASLALVAVVVAGVSALSLGGDPAPIPVAVLLAFGLLAAVGIRSTTTWDELRESRVLRALAAVFEPPEPPASRTQAGTGGLEAANSTDERETERSD